MRTNKARWNVLGVAIAAVGLAMASATRADDFNWNSAVNSGNWATASDWKDFENASKSGPPTSIDNAYVGFGDTVTVSALEYIFKLNLGYVWTGSQQSASSATLIVNANEILENSGKGSYVDAGNNSSILVNGGSLYAGTLNIGVLNSAASMNANSNAAVEADELVISNASTVTFDTGANLQFDSQASVIKSSTLTIQNNSSFNFQGAELDLDTGGALALNNNSNASGGYLSVGNSGSATTTIGESCQLQVGGVGISNGGSIVVSDGELDATSTGNIYPDGNQSDYIYSANFNPGEIDVGGSGNPATLTINSGGEVDCLHMVISDGSTVTANGLGSNGSANIDIDQSGELDIEGGSSVILKNSGEIDAYDMRVGSDDDNTAGTLIVESGSRIFGNSINIQPSSSVVLDGEGSFINIDQMVAEGGSLTVENGGNLFDTLGVIFKGSTVTVSDGGSTWTSSTLYVGYPAGGSGSLAVQNGGVVSSAGSITADYGSTITVNGGDIYGGASSLTAAGNLYVGYSGSATINIEGGGYVSDLNGFVGYLNGSSAQATVNNTGSVWNNTQGFYVNANSVLTVENGGAVDAAVGTAAYLSLIQISSGGSLNIAGSFNDGGQVNVGVGGTASFGALTGTGYMSDYGTMIFTPSRTGSVSASFYGTGALQMSGTGTLAISSSNPNFSGTVSVNSGTLQLNNANALGPGLAALAVGPAGILDLNGNTLSTATLSGYGVIENISSAANASLTVNGSANSTFYGSIHNSSGTVALTKSGAGVLTLVGTNTYTGATTINAGGTLALDSTGALPVNGNVVNNGILLVNANTIAGSVTGSGTVQTAPGVTFTADFTQRELINNGTTILSGAAQIGSVVGNGNLNLTSTANVRLTGSAMNTVQSLSISTGGLLDLGSSSLMIDYANNPDPVSSVRGNLVGGYDHGKWDGTGIISSAAASNIPDSTTLGYRDTGTQIIIKYTWFGDANLDGVINAADLTAISAGGTTWSTGDFNYDGVVNADDYTLFMLGVAESGGENISVTLPEPGPGILAVGVCFWLSSRGRSR